MAKTKSSEVPKRIVVAGDVAVDWFEVATPEGKSGAKSNWQKYPGTLMFARRGGALLLADLIKATGKARVFSHELDGIEKISAENVVHSIAFLEPVLNSTLKGDEKNFVYRIKRYKGFAGPATGTHLSLKLKIDDPDADIVVIDDPGNGYRYDQSKWPLVLKGNRKPLVIYKMSFPFSDNPLWDMLQKSHAERLVVVITADDLRLEGAKISRRLSWERTAMDFAWQISSNLHLGPLNNCAYLIVRFGVDGAILHRRWKGDVETRLFYDPKVEEDGFGALYPGTMQGLGATFVAVLTEHIGSKGLSRDICEGVRQGIVCSRLIWQRGFGKELTALDYPSLGLFNNADTSSISDIVIPTPSKHNSANPEFWCIADELSRGALQGAARNYVLCGKDAVIDKVPSGRFRNLLTIDRSEIESFRSIRNLICEYLSRAKKKNPLCIAVFGKPGSGKSFGITEVADSAAPGQIETIEFNLSQFESTADLIAAFHRVRDIAMGGKVPLVFFDEFDSSFGGDLGWLKFFLSPMQDGIFSDGGAIHPLGNAIFVFAGGTSSSLEAFSIASGKVPQVAQNRTAAEAALKQDEAFKAFKNAKGPDFISRLRGFVNIKGPDQTDANDNRYILRRAILLRSLLLKNAKHLAADGVLSIDPGVLRALLKIPTYKHGVRSMTAIIEMSLLAGRKVYEQAALPSPEQLDLHVDAKIFNRLVMCDVLLGSERERIARAIHERFLKEQRAKKVKGKRSLVPWSRLDEDLKESNRLQGDSIPSKLDAIHCSFELVDEGSKPRLITFSKSEIEMMARMEHERWNAEKFLLGWSYGKPRNDELKIHDCLVSWEELPNKIKQYDRDAVKAIPYILGDAGFEIHRD